MVETIERRSGPMPATREGGRTPECLAPRHRGIGLPAVAAAAAQMSRANAAEAEAARTHAAKGHPDLQDGSWGYLMDDTIAA